MLFLLREDKLEVLPVNINQMCSSFIIYKWIQMQLQRALKIICRNLNCDAVVNCIQKTSKIKEIIKIIKVVISYIRKHWGTSRGTKVTKFKPAWSCQSLLASNLHIHKEKARKIRQWKCSQEYTVCWFGSSVVWDKLMGWEKKGEEVAGNMVAKQRKDNRERRREHMHRSTGTNNSSLPPDLQVRAVYHFRENIASLNQHTHTHTNYLPSLSQRSEQLSDTSGLLWGECMCVCVCAL